MKKSNLLKALFLLVLVAGLITACSKDDGGGGDKFGDVPKGEIVPVGQRNEALIGFSGDQGRGTLNTGSQKWWKQVQSKVDYHCGDYEDLDLHEDNFYIAFKPDGTMYYKIGLNGDEYPHYDWEWEDADKDAIIMEGQTFEIRELNDGGVTYASYQEQGSDCYAITWEHFE